MTAHPCRTPSWLPCSDLSIICFGWTAVKSKISIISTILILTLWFIFRYPIWWCPKKIGLPRFLSSIFDWDCPYPESPSYWGTTMAFIKPPGPWISISWAPAGSDPGAGLFEKGQKKIRTGPTPKKKHEMDGFINVYNGRFDGTYVWSRWFGWFGSISGHLQAGIQYLS